MDIKTGFSENKYNLFVKHCQKKGFRTIKDLENFNFQTLYRVQGIGCKKVEEIIARYAELRMIDNRVAGHPTSSDARMSVTDRLFSLRNVPIAEMFQEPHFDRFRTFCADKGFAVLSDLYGFDFVGAGFAEKEKTFFEAIFSEPKTSEETDVWGLTQDIHSDFLNYPICCVRDSKLASMLEKEFYLKKIADLGEFGFDELLRRPSYGKKKVRDILETCSLFTHSFQEYILAIQEEIKALPYYDVLERRVFYQLTLEEVGESRGVTRERIRQIEKKLFSCLAEMLKPVDYYIGKRLQDSNQQYLSLGELCVEFGSSDFCHILYSTMAHKPKAFRFTATHTLLPGIVRSDIQAPLNAAIEEVMMVHTSEGLLHLDEQTWTQIQTIFQDNGITLFDIERFKELLLKMEYHPHNGSRHWKKGVLTRSDAAISVMKDEFKTGIKDSPLHLERLESLVQDRFLKSFGGKDKLRNIWMLIERHPQTILWGPSTRNHISNVVVNDFVLMAIEYAIDEALEITDMVSSHSIYEKLETELHEGSNIRNKHGLFGVVHYYFGNKYHCKKLTIRKNTAYLKSTTVALESFVRETGGCVEYKKVLNDSGWTLPMISAAASKSDDIIVVKQPRCLATLDYFDFDGRFVKKFRDEVSKCFIQGYTNAHMILKRMHSYLEKYDLADPYSVYALAKAFCGDKYVFCRKPHILNGLDPNAFSNDSLLRIIFGEEKSLPQEELYRRIEEEFCFDGHGRGRLLNNQNCLIRTHGRYMLRPLECRYFDDQEDLVYPLPRKELGL